MQVTCHATARIDIFLALDYINAIMLCALCRRTRTG